MKTVLTVVNAAKKLVFKNYFGHRMFKFSFDLFSFPSEERLKTTLQPKAQIKNIKMN